jgi:hypothetical protein
MILTYAESYEPTVSLDTGHIPSDEPWFVCWVPTTWGDSPRTADVSEADDWKDVIFSAPSLTAARKMAIDTFGVEAQVTVEAA